jgi:hypothetical protein
MHFLVFGRCDEAGGGLGLIDRPIPVNLGASWLRLGFRFERLGCSLGVIEPLTVVHDGIRVSVSQ